MNVEEVYFSENERLYFVGPPLDRGALPSFFYFSISGHESLSLDPFNQVVKALKPYPMRIFSLDIPGHTKGSPPKESIATWKEALEKGENFVHTFCRDVERALHFLFHRRLLIEGKIAVGGLSRGAFLALHAGALFDLLNPILGFAPLLNLDENPLFAGEGVVEKARALNASTLIAGLLSKKVLLTVGNRDTLVGTQNSFAFVQALAEAKHQAGHPTLDVELTIKPSIGRLGHGTARTTFEEGAAWLAQALGLYR